jgi:L-threonylcarbamoyladenylate synthase
VSLTVEDAQRLRDCVAGGGVGIFPSDTVYGVCCDPEDEQAAARLYELKGRPAARASAVMFFTLADALGEIEEHLHDSEAQALRSLLPGPVTLLLANRAGRFGPACTIEPHTLGLRVPLLDGGLAALQSTGRPVLQSSANLSGAPDARTLAEVSAQLREGVDLVLDVGELPGRSSTVLDLRELHGRGRWNVVREGALGLKDVTAALGPSH